MLPICLKLPIFTGAGRPAQAKEKEEKRIENLAVHDTTVAKRDEFDRILPQRVGNGVLNESLAVEVESQNASGEFAHVKVLEVDEKQPHDQEIPGNHRPAHAYDSLPH